MENLQQPMKTGGTWRKTIGQLMQTYARDCKSNEHEGQVMKELTKIEENRGKPKKMKGTPLQAEKREILENKLKKPKLNPDLLFN